MTDRKITSKIKIISFIVVLVLIALDQIIKYFVVLKLKAREPFVVIKDVLQFRYLENDGAMMGFMQGKTAIMTVFAVICVIAMLVVIFSGLIKDKVNYFCTILMIAGGVGNIIDRIFRGFVVDFIEVLFVDFYVFNFADCLVTVSAFMLIFYQIYLIIKEDKEKKQVTAVD
ncbi:MAG: signal peptidase II [Acutalibacteraceae bacterium]